MTLLVSDPDFTLYVGDAVASLALLEASSVDCVVTSPPYWGLRDYGDERQIGLEQVPDCLGWATQEPCGSCYVCSLVGVFSALRPALATHGTVWLNLGDSYASKSRGSDLGWDKSRLTNPGSQQKAQSASLRRHGQRHRGKSAGLKEKDLAGVPWRVALALQADGWWLRSDIVWSKPNAMPESTRDRPTKAHEYVFLLTKNARYYFDGDAVREPHRSADDPRRDLELSGEYVPSRQRDAGGRTDGFTHVGPTWHPLGRNVRTVWEITTQPNRAEHFAIMPPRLVERCILAGAPPPGLHRVW